MTAPSSPPAPALVVDGVSKSFQLPHERVHTLKERALHPFRRSGHERLDALKNVSFAVQPGEFFGIVGRNGSGKSTLLKCLAGIYGVDQGAIYLNGRLSTFIELGVGFNPDLAARDNVKLNGIMLGLSPKEADARFERVIEFAELQEFEELKLKNYSSGMHVRLAFSVMIQVDADVLLIDEVLAVGDAAFQQKCFDVFNRMRDERKTILFVTHDMGSVQRFCHRALLIERGEVVMIDEPDRVANHYIEVNFGRDTDPDAVAAESERFGDQSAQIVDAWFEDEHGERRNTLPQGRPCAFKTRVAFRAAVENAAVAVLFENDRHHPLFATTSERIEPHSGRFEPGDEVVYTVRFDNPFAPGRLFASPWTQIADHGTLMDRRPRLVSAIVTGTYESGSLVDLPHDAALTRETPSGAAAPGVLR